MIAWRYRFAGLVFESALRIPEWDAFGGAEADSVPDVRIDLDEECGAGALDDAALTVSRDECAFAVPGVGRFRVSHGRRIVVAPVEGAEDRAVRLFLLGSALAALCAQRDLLLLHASVVRLADRTVALCGPTGAGKSTLAAALIDRGAEFVCDDLGRFDVVDGRATVYPSTPRLKLMPEALEALPWSPATFERVHARATKFHVPQAHRDPWSPVPLHAIYLLAWADGPVQVTTLTGRASLQAVVAAATYRPGLLEPMGQVAAHWQRCAAVVGGTPVSRLSRPREWSALHAVVSALETRS